MELKAGAEPRRGGDGKSRGSTREQRRALEIAELEQVEADYRAMVASKTSGDLEMRTAERT
jgi:hypothetical protein